MDDKTRNTLLNATQQVRRLLETDVAEQLEGDFDILPDGTIAEEDPPHLDARQRLTRAKIVESIRHRAGGSAQKQRLEEAIASYVRETAFTILNRFIALKMLEVRGLVQQCISKGDESSGFKEFCLSAPAINLTPDKGYRLYLECLFDELSLEVKVLFDRHDSVSLAWPRRKAFESLLDILNAVDLSSVWAEDETIGWVYQYFNSDDDRRKARYDAKGKPKAPQNSYELAVRNQFFTPRYVVEFLVDNTLGRTWFEMRQGNTALADKCRYLVRRPDEVFLSAMTDPKSDHAEAGCIALAKLFDEDSTADFPEFQPGDTQRLIDLAHCVDGYERHPLEDDAGNDWWPWPTKARMKAADDLSGFTTQDILDVMFCQCRADRQGDGAGIEEPVFLRLANEVRRRVLEAREPDRTQEQLLKQPVFVRHRPRKDPRDLKILDPACGSSHFLIYCFDLLLEIYAEAWADEQSPPSRLTGKTLREDYPDEASLRLALPGLILRQNLHGIDIDPRCAQIGAFALWMRAQRAFNEFKISREERPPITRANIAVAEPMPAEADLLQAFKSDIKPAVLGQLMEVVVDKMRLAGDAGSLLKIHEELADAIKKARKEWGERPKEEQAMLFGGAKPKAQQSSFDFSGVTDDSFWEQAEAQTLNALQRFAESAANGQRYRRSLFAEDAAAGFAFIDICRTTMDVVLMNPPFGALPAAAQTYVTNRISAGRNDAYAAFVVRGREMLRDGGRLGAISSRSFLSGRHHKDFRLSLMQGSRSNEIEYLVDLGWGILDDALVETAAYTLERGGFDRSLFSDTRKGPRLHDGIEELHWHHRRRSFFNLVPGNQLLYWLSSEQLELLNADSRFEPDLGRVTKGLSTSDDERFVRLRWEVPAEVDQPRWIPFSKGGEYGWFSGDTHLVINWASDGKEVAAFNDFIGGNVARSRQSSRYYFLPAIRWSRRSTRGLSFRRMRRGTIFSDKSPVVVTSRPKDAEWLGILLASDLYHGLVEDQSTGGSYETGAVKVLPVPDSKMRPSATACRAVYQLADTIASSSETSPLFCLPRSIANTPSVALLIQNARDALSEVNLDLASDIADLVQTATSDEEDDNEIESEGATSQAEDLCSWSVGVAVGRFDVRLVTGEREAPPEPDPFDPLPVCSPGMLTGDDGLPVAEPPAGYPIAWPTDGVLVDDPGHPRDIVAAVRSVFDVVFGAESDAYWAEAASILDPKGHDLRTWLAKSFFEHHIKKHSKSRRKAPILWQLGVPSGKYAVWLYAHRVTGDSLFSVLNEILRPKLDQEESLLGRLKADAGASPTSGQRKEIEAQEDFASELKTMIEEVARVAPLWSPDLDDGVVICLAPLWRLFPQHKPWQKECKKIWDKLVAGDYDWAHLAMHLWPERVVPKCQDDRSLAIAHGLEDVFWEQDDKEKWHKRKAPGPNANAKSWVDLITRLVNERTSRQVKDALSKLIAAGQAAGNSGSRKRGRTRSK
tara:strand:- start:7890 stop:12305 length:4416 start_codon:yes stop_codon:yes gene_type:complete